MIGPCILGGAQSDFSRSWSKTDGFRNLFSSVLEAGLIDAGLDSAEIKRLNSENRIACFVGNFNGEQFFSQGHLGAFFSEFDPAFSGVPGARYEAACASGSVAIDNASARIRAGDYDVAVVLGIEVMKTVGPMEANDFLGLASFYEHEAKGVRFVFPKIFGMITDQVLSRTGIAEDRLMSSLSEISKINYSNAKSNPLAQTREQDSDFTQADARFSRSFGGRTRFSDCSQITDGAVLMVLASPEYAKTHLKKHQKRLTSTISGWGHVCAPVSLNKKLEIAGTHPDMIPWTARAIDQACTRAGIEKKQIDVIETHDCFTISEYLAVSSFGITKQGEEFQAVENGSLQRNGANPINPSGGLIGAGHPVGASGIRMMLDLSRQVTETAGETQVAEAKVGSMLNIGGSFTTNFSFIVNRHEF